MKKFQRNNVVIAFNILHANKEKKYPVYVSNHKSNLEKQVTFLMIPNREGWYYLAVKKVLALLRGIKSWLFLLSELVLLLQQKINFSGIKGYDKRKISVKS